MGTKLPKELELLFTVTDTLSKLKIKYMLTGSFAMHFYAVPRMTRDIDIVIQLESRDVPELIEHLSDKFYIDEKMIKEAILKEGMFNIIHMEAVLKIDLIIKKTSEYRQIEFKRRKEMELFGKKIAVVSPEDLVVSKLFWSKDSYSELQLNDIRNLIKMVKSLDKKYIEKWIKKLGLEEVYLKI